MDVSGSALNSGTYDQLMIASAQRTNDQQKLDGEMALKLIESASIAPAAVASPAATESMATQIDIFV